MILKPFILFFLLLPMAVLSQKKAYTIYGHVEDSVTGEKLPEASIFAKNELSGTTPTKKLLKSFISTIWQHSSVAENIIQNP